MTWLRWVMRSLRRMDVRVARARTHRDAARYRQVLTQVKRELPDDPAIRRVLEEFDRAEQKVRARL